MSHPVYHAEVSKKFLDSQGIVFPLEKHIRVHKILDGTKELIADARHRAFRHNIDFIHGLAERGELDNGDVLIALSHIAEDMEGRLPSKEDWKNTLMFKPWMELSPSSDRARIGTSLASRYGGEESDYREILSHLSVYSWQDGLYTLHSHACFEAERIYGESIILSSGKRAPTRYVAETIIKSSLRFKNIPPASEWITSIKRERWMNRPCLLEESVPLKLEVKKYISQNSNFLNVNRIQNHGELRIEVSPVLQTERSEDEHAHGY